MCSSFDWSVNIFTFISYNVCDPPLPFFLWQLRQLTYDRATSTYIFFTRLSFYSIDIHSNSAQISCPGIFFDRTDHIDI